MPGTKGKSGGPRKNAGPPQRNLHLDKETARMLNYLKLDRREVLHDDMFTALQTVQWLIREKYKELWQKDDEIYQQNARIVLEGEEEYMNKAREEQRDATRLD